MNDPVLERLRDACRRHLEDLQATGRGAYPCHRIPSDGCYRPAASPYAPGAVGCGSPAALCVESAGRELPEEAVALDG